MHRIKEEYKGEASSLNSMKASCWNINTDKPVTIVERLNGDLERGGNTFVMYEALNGGKLTGFIDKDMLKEIGNEE